MKRTLSGIEDELHEVASANTGLHDFGDPSYREPLRALLNAFDTDMKVTENGYKLLYHYFFLGPLTARLYAQKGWAEHPEVLSASIKRPLVILGMPRCGTTALHRLLSEDPQFQGPELWLTQRPVVRPPRETWESVPEYRACLAHTQFLVDHMPGMAKAHDLDANEVEECKYVKLQTFVRAEMAAWVPTYGRWYAGEKQKVRESYHRYADILRLIGSGAPDRRWLLKDPHHMAEMDSLLDVFPDACIIHAHRDPFKAIPSLCSLWCMAQQAMQGDNTRPETLGLPECLYWSKHLENMDAVRRKRPKQYYDVEHRQLVADPIGTVHAIYDHFGLTLSPSAEHAMRAWVAASPTTKHGKHEYSLEGWGITAGQVREIFANYYKQHDFH